MLIVCFYRITWIGSVRLVDIEYEIVISTKKGGKLRIVANVTVSTYGECFFLFPGL